MENLLLKPLKLHSYYQLFRQGGLCHPQVPPDYAHVCRLRVDFHNNRVHYATDPELRPKLI